MPISNSAQQTMNIAKDLALSLKGGEVICLYGFLGAGKTVFTKGLALGLGIEAHVTSPTFTVMNLYSGKSLKLCHCDAYRLSGIDDAPELTDYFGQSGIVTVVEWPEKIADFLADFNTISVSITSINENNRQIIIGENNANKQTTR